MENVGLTFTLVSSKAHREGVGLRVADSHTGNHPKGGFTPFETIRRLLVVIGRRSHSGFEGETFEPERRSKVTTVSIKISTAGTYYCLCSVSAAGYKDTTVADLQLLEDLLLSGG
ncbi:hypothetical protein Tco_0593226 [Tanacetum coccineum]